MKKIPEVTKNKNVWPSEAWKWPGVILKKGDQVAADRAFWRCTPSHVELVLPANTNNPNTEESDGSRRVCAIR